MSYLQIDMKDTTTGLQMSCIVLEYDRFLADVYKTADSSYEKWDEYPTEYFHERMEKMLADIWEEKQKLPMIFTVPLDEHMSFSGDSCRYTFAVMDKAFFKRIRHEYEADRKTRNKCRSKDTDCIVIYAGMNR